jgi:hypothetical protein
MIMFDQLTPRTSGVARGKQAKMNSENTTAAGGIEKPGNEEFWVTD